jgi:hypothetical protein
VVIIALLASIHPVVSATRASNQAVSAAYCVIDVVAVIADFFKLSDAIPAGLVGLAVFAAPIPIVLIAVVTDLSFGEVAMPIAAGLVGATVAAAAVA